MRRFLLRIGLVAGALASAPAALAYDDYAYDPKPAARDESRALAALSEQDVTLLFDYLRAAVAAAAAGRDPDPLPPELRERVAALGAELKARGTLAALLVLSTLEQELQSLARRAARRTTDAPPHRSVYAGVSALTGAAPRIPPACGF